MESPLHGFIFHKEIIGLREKDYSGIKGNKRRGEKRVLYSLKKKSKTRCVTSTRVLDAQGT